jgi:hypothetical protein
VATELFAGLRYVSGLLDSLDVYAGLLARVGDAEPAARLWGARYALDDEIGRERSHPLDVAARNESVAEVRVALGDEAFERAWERGSAMTLDEAVAFGLAQGSPVADAT